MGRRLGLTSYSQHFMHKLEAHQKSKVVPPADWRPARRRHGSGGADRWTGNPSERSHGCCAWSGGPRLPAEAAAARWPAHP